MRSDTPGATDAIPLALEPACLSLAVTVASSPKSREEREAVMA
jgi:hypothetical protein